MAFKKVYYTISNSHPKLIIKNYFSSTAAQKFKGFSTTFKELPCLQALSRGLNFENRIQALSRIFQAPYERSQRLQACTLSLRVLSLQPITWRVSEWVCRVYRPSRHIIGHIGDESFQAINCTGTDNQKQSNTTLHTPETQKRNRKKTALANKTILTLIWYGFYYLRSGNGVGPILTAPEPKQGECWRK